MKILIRNLDRNITEAELKILFEEYGAVQSCNVVLDESTGGSNLRAWQRARSGCKTAVQMCFNS